MCFDMQGRKKKKKPNNHNTSFTLPKSGDPGTLYEMFLLQGKLASSRLARKCCDNFLFFEAIFHNPAISYSKKEADIILPFKTLHVY